MLSKTKRRGQIKTRLGDEQMDKARDTGHADNALIHHGQGRSTTACDDQFSPDPAAGNHPEIPDSSSAGVKYDSEKPRYDLLISDMPLALEEVVLVLTDGARKYAPANWERVENGERRYLAAGLRHEVAHAQGEPHDEETGRRHLAHKICCDLFRLELEMRKERDHG